MVPFGRQMGYYKEVAMPKNRVMYLGVLVLSASVLLYLGAVLLNYIQWFLPWSAGAGVALILIGLAMELRKSAKAKAATEAAASMPVSSDATANAPAAETSTTQADSSSSQEGRE